MMNATHDSDIAADPTAAPAPGTEDQAKPEDDPMKMMQESMEKDSTSK
jgi:hypothetical protein